MRHLVLSFRGILWRGKVSSLRRWTNKAEAIGVEAIGGFVRQVRTDGTAVENCSNWRRSYVIASGIGAVPLRFMVSRLSATP